MFGENTSATVRAEDHSAMQTLAPASLTIVMTAISHARAKGHCQVQPLHVAAALLDPLIRSVALHNACLESLKQLTATGTPPHLLQCNALDLCFKVALDRLPVITDPEKCKEQTMSNALAAALKRAHANERRGTPEQSLQPLLAVKTGTAHLTISILDDPSVNRVFREAGFSSMDVKAKMEETVAQAALACSHPPSPLFDSSGTCLRRVPYAVASYCNPRLDSSVQLRSSPLSPSMFATVDTHGRRLKYSLQDMQLPETGRTTRQDADVAIFAPQYNRLEQAPFFPRQTDNSLRFGLSRHDAEIRKIVEAFLSPKKRNPVLLSDRRAGPVLKEFSQRLARGEVPLLFGVKLLELPFTSLSVGMLSPEAVEQKLAKLRRDVDGCMPTGGAIVSVGDLQWLLEPSQSIAPLVLQQLHQLLSSNTSNRLWLLATSSPDAFKGFQFNKNPSLEDLALQPIELTCDTKDSSHFLRYGSTSGSWSGETTLLCQLGSGGRMAAAPKTSSTESGIIVESDLCAECNRSFQLECASLRSDNRTLFLEPGMSSSSAMSDMEISSDMHTQHQNLRGKIEWGCDPLRVKEEESQIPRRVEDVRKAWRSKCAALHSVSDSILSGSFKRDQFTSPVTEILSRSEKMARNVDPSHSPSSLSKSIPQPSTPVSPSSRDRIPLHARIAHDSTSRFLSPVKPPLIFANGDAEKYEKSNLPRGASLNWSVKNGPSFGVGPGVSRSDIRHPHGIVGTDLVLGRSSVDSGISLAGSGRSRQEGQQLSQDNRSPQQSSSPKSEKMMPNSGTSLSLHGINESLGKSVPWQKAAVGAVASAVLRCRSGEGPKMGAYPRTNSWLMFLGPDGVGKREVAKALAKCIFGKVEHLILMTGWSSDNGNKASCSAGILPADITGKKYLGRTPLERLAEAVHQNPCSVVLLEDIDRADYFLMKNLLKARHTGKLQDSSGREVSLANVIIVMTCDAGASVVNRHYPDVHAQDFLGIHEDAFCGLSPLDFKLQVHNSRSEKVLHTSKNGSLSIVDCASEEKLDCSEDRGQAGSILIFGSQIAKRKVSELSCGNDEAPPECLPYAKKQKNGLTSPVTGLCLDLNLSAGEVLSRSDSCTVSDTPDTEQQSLEDVETQVIKLAQEKFPAEMFTLLDGMVVFKPFNMRGLTNLVLEKLEQATEDAMPKIRVPVEIDKALLQVMVFSAWRYFCTLEKFQAWIDSVLVRAISGALERSFLKAGSVLKLIASKRHSENVAVNLTLDSSAELLPKPIQA